MNPEDPDQPTLNDSQIEDLRLAAAHLSGPERRAFQAAMTIKYCQGQARLAETRFGWNRHNVKLGLAERRTGLICVGAQSGFSGNLQWEDRYPEAASALRQLAEAHAQQDPTFNSTLAYTRLTAAEALRQMAAQGFAESVLPAASTMSVILNRMGYRLRRVVKAKPQKKFQKRT